MILTVLCQEEKICCAFQSLEVSSISGTYVNTCSASLSNPKSCWSPSCAVLCSICSSRRSWESLRFRGSFSIINYFWILNLIHDLNIFQGSSNFFDGLNYFCFLKFLVWRCSWNSQNHSNFSLISPWSLHSFWKFWASPMEIFCVCLHFEWNPRISSFYCCSKINWGFWFHIDFCVLSLYFYLFHYFAWVHSNFESNHFYFRPPSSRNYRMK